MLAGAHDADLLADLVNAAVLELLQVYDLDGHASALEALLHDLRFPHQAEGAHADGDHQLVEGSLSRPLEVLNTLYH